MHRIHIDRNALWEHDDVSLLMCQALNNSTFYSLTDWHHAVKSSHMTDSGENTALINTNGWVMKENPRHLYCVVIYFSTKFI